MIFRFSQETPHGKPVFPVPVSEVPAKKKRPRSGQNAPGCGQTVLFYAKTVFPGEHLQHHSAFLPPQHPNSHSLRKLPAGFRHPGSRARGEDDLRRGARGDSHPQGEHPSPAAPMAFNRPPHAVKDTAYPLQPAGKGRNLLFPLPSVYFEAALWYLVSRAVPQKAHGPALSRSYSGERGNALPEGGAHQQQKA